MGTVRVFSILQTLTSNASDHRIIDAWKSISKPASKALFQRVREDCRDVGLKDFEMMSCKVQNISHCFTYAPTRYQLIKDPSRS